MGLVERHAIRVVGRGKLEMIMAHGFGCDQSLWRLITPAFEDKYRIVLFDLAGCGGSDLTAYDRKKYATLAGHAQDLIEISFELTRGPAVFVGHSVGAMIGLLADVARPSIFESHVMIGPSPCYINDGDYVGGFERSDVEAMLESMNGDYLGWARTMAPRLMGTPDRPELIEEIVKCLSRTDPEIAKHFARVTVLSDNRTDVPKLRTPSLVIQSSDDILAPQYVGEYLHRRLPKNEFKTIENHGHFPHLSAPEQVIAAMREFLP